MALVRVPGALKVYLNHQEQVEVQANSLFELLQAMQQTYPEFTSLILDNAGHLKDYVSIQVDYKNIPDQEYSEIKLAPNSEVFFLPGVSGG